MSLVTEKRNLISEIQEAFQQFEGSRDPLRQKAFEKFLINGLPHLKTEEYKFTPITRTLEKVLDLAPHVPGNAEIISPIEGLTVNLIVFVNGIFSPDRSVILDKTVSVQRFASGADGQNDDPFDLLNQAFHPTMVTISVRNGATPVHPIAICYHFDAKGFVFANPRWKCTIESGSSATILEYVSYVGEPAYFNNKHSTIEVAENGNLEYVIIQNGSASDFQVNNSNIYLASKARASCFTETFGGHLVRNNLTVALDGEGIDIRLHGLYLLSGTTLADNHTSVDHQKPNSFSNEIYKGVMDGNSKGVFNGKIFVRPDAQKTNAFQSNRNILLSENAGVNTKPQLEIWADDVKCSHGCTTGQLDEEALFYLRSRGISKEMARGMMLYAFAAETFAPMKNELIRNFVDKLVSEKLHRSF